MEPLNDDELKQALQGWKAPDAPASLERRVLPREPWWRWLLKGSIQIPVPAVIAIAILVVAVYAVSSREPSATPVKPAVSLSDFQPVETVDVQVVRRPQ